MIYLTPDELSTYYGKPFSGPGVPLFNEERYKSHADSAFKYRFGLVNGRCIYAIIVKKTGLPFSLVEAGSFRALNGKGIWSFMTNLLPDKNAEAIEKLFGDKKVNLNWSYAPVPGDQYQSTLFCSHQAGRTQLVIWHPKWHVDLDKIQKMGPNAA
jgi:hypothetical protein